MEARATRMLELIRKSDQFRIPIYQRTYSWGEQECEQLWKDIIRTGSDDKILAHFIGSIVYILPGHYVTSSQKQLLVIDGQQRLTSLLLIIESLVRCLGRLGDAEPHDGFSARKLRNRYLRDPDEAGERRYKLLLTQTDKETLLSILDRKDHPKEHSLRLKANFEFFEKRVNALGDDLKPLCKGLEKLMVIDTSLEREYDNPQLIFESMNSTGRALSQADLIRNFILMGLDPEHQGELYKDHWRPMEEAFGQKDYVQHFDGFMRHYLTVKTGEIPRIGDVYDAFKKHAQTVGGKVADLLADLHTFAGYYCVMALDPKTLGQKSWTSLDIAFADLRKLKVDVAYPLLLELYHDYKKSQLSEKELEQAVRLVESYIFRRAVCSIPTNSHNKTFANFAQELKKDRYLESIQAHLLGLPSYRRFPDDDEFKREFVKRDLYNFPRRSYWLRCLENHERKECVEVDEYTTEHILPQNENLSEKWREELGPEWKRVQETWLHTPGNLTLTGYNSEYSDRSFGEKRDMTGGFKESPLRLNKGLGDLKNWNEETIEERANEMAEKAARVWAAPSLPDEVLKSYHSPDEKVADCSTDDYTHLAPRSPMRVLFDAFRKEVLALDPCVSEARRKHYIAYKAETNFVSVRPQKSRLLLWLNLRFHELRDRNDVAKDMTDIGHLGAGDVEVGLSESEAIPYVMSLVRQAYENQMDE